MQIAQILAGYSLGEADLLRRAMGKKIQAEMDAQRERFVTGAVERGIERAHADAIFDLLRTFADYGFNKSHAAAYALVAYQTAYLKANYPVEFLAASMTLDMGNTDKLAEFRAEARAARHQGRAAVGQPLGRRLRGRRQHDPSTRSRRSRASARRRSRRIVAARGDKPFADLADFARRINPRAVNKRVLESLAAAGAFDALEPNRARAIAAVDAMLVDRAAHPRGGRRSARTTCSAAPARRETHRDPGGRALAAGRAAAARIRRHRLLPLRPSARRLRGAAARSCKVQSWTEFSRSVKAGRERGPRRRDRGVAHRAAHQDRQQDGHLRPVRSVRPLRGDRCSPKGLQQYRDMLEPGAPVLLFLSAEAQGDEVRARIQTAEPLDQAAAKLQKGLRVFLRDQAPLEPVAKRLDGKGDGEVSMVLQLGGGAEVEVKLPGRFKVSPQIAGAIKAVPGVLDVQLI